MLPGPAQSGVRGLIRLSTVWLAVGASALALGHAQEPAPAFRVSSDLVVIDLVAVDRDGRFIDDLRADEIEVKDGGTRQAIQFLRRVGTPAATGWPIPPRSDMPGVPGPTGGQAAPAADTRRLAIVVDTLSLSVDAIPRVRDALVTALADVPAGMPVLVATIGQDVRILQPFTTDTDALRRAVAAVPAQLDPPVGVSRIFDAVDRVCAAAVDQSRAGAAAIEAAELMLGDAQARSAAASASLARLADRLAMVEGRKHLVFYSSGYAISPVTQAVDAVAAAVSACTGVDAMLARRDATSALGRHANRAAADGLRAAIDRANRAQLTFYTVDPVGITTGTILPSTRGTAESGGRGPRLAFPGLRPDAGRDYVGGLAAETGGLTVRSNDLALVLRRAWDDASQYYLIGYPPPPGRREGEVRTIAVSVKRRGASVRFRRGYVSIPPAATPVPKTETTTTEAVPTPRDAPAPPPSVPPPPARTDVPLPDDVAEHLTRAAAYVDGFVERFSNVVLQESLTQTYTEAPTAMPGRSRVLTPGRTTTRRLRSEFLLVRPPSTAFWLAFRDVVDVDGKAVVDRQDRLEQLFLQGTRSGLAEARRIAADGARFFLGAATRTTTSPVFALAFLQPHHQPRFRYRLQHARGRDQAPRLVLTADEIAQPTLLRTESGGNLPLHGRYDIDPTTGTVQVSEITLRIPGESLVLRTRFALDARTQAFVPVEMTEEHLMRSGTRVLTNATYGQVRSFSVTTSEAVP
jgi:VWFA-related protein